MNTNELKKYDLDLSGTDVSTRMRLVASFITSQDVINEPLQREVSNFYEQVGYMIQAIRQLGISKEQLISELDLPEDQKEIITKYIYDLDYFGGLGSAVDRRKKNKNAPVNQPENIKKVKAWVGIFSAITVGSGAILGPVVTSIQNKRQNELEQMRIEQQNRELDQRDRELDILEGKK